MRIAVPAVNLPDSLIFLELPDLRLKELLSRAIINATACAAPLWSCGPQDRRCRVRLRKATASKTPAFS